MATLYVSGSGNDPTGNGSSGNPWRTLKKAHDSCATGDTILLRNGTYAAGLSITKANTTWRADTGHTPVIDGGYSAAMFTSGTGTSKKIPTPANPTIGISLSAVGVTLDGVVVQNIPGTGIVLDGISTTVKNCVVFFTYGCAILSNKTNKTLHHLTIENNTCCMASINIFDPNRKQNQNPNDQSVVGVMKVGNTIGGTIIRGNRLCFGFGEGLNFGKFNRDDEGLNIIEGNTIHDNNHTLLYVNRSWGVVVRNNVLFHTGDTIHRWTDGDVSVGLSITDEEGETTPSWQESKRVYAYNNLVVNTSPLFRHAMQDETTAVFEDIYVGFNTFVGGPETGIAVNNGGGQVVQSHLQFKLNAGTKALIENNIVDTTNSRSAAAVDMVRGSLAGITFRNNLWGVQPQVTGARGPGDRVGNPQLSNARAPVRLTGTYPEFVTNWSAVSFGHTLNKLNYKLSEESTLAIDRASARATAGGVTPPAEPFSVDHFGSGRDSNPDIGFNELGTVGPPAPIAAFSHVPTGTALLTGTAVAFTDTSTAPSTTITGWSWVIKKGGVTQSTLTTRNINYTFGSAGTWTVALTITTASAETDTETRTFVISDPTGTPTAAAAFTRSPSATTIDQGTLIHFTDTSLVTNTTQTGRTWEVRTSPGGTLVASGTNATFDHLFNTAGTFTVKLAITTAAAVNDDETVTITVNPVTTPTVTAAFTLSATTILAGGAVTVATNPSAATDTTITGYVWTWGDGGTGTGATPSHTYVQAGVYIVTLLVNTAAGISATATATVVVQAIVSGGEGNSVIVPHRAAVNTSTGNQTVTATALGTLTPKAVLVTMSGATADGTAATGALLCVGATDGGAQWVNTRFSANGLADSNAARRWTDDALLLSIDGDGAVTGKASYVQFVPGGVTINVTDGFPSAYLADFVFFAGDDMEAWVGTATGGAFGSVKTITTGIAQDAIIAVGTWGQRDTVMADADMSIGFATAAAQFSIRTEDRDAQATAITRVRHSLYLANTGDSDTANYAALEARNFTTTGFELVTRGAAMTTNTVCLLAFKSATGVYLTNAALSTGATSVHALPFEAQAVLGVLSSATAVDTAANGEVGETLGVYVGSVHGPAEFTSSIAADHGATTTATRSLSENRFEAVKPDGSSLFDGVGALNAADFTATWSVAPAAGYLALLLAVEAGEEIEEPPVDPPPVAAFASDVQSGTIRFLVQFDSSPSNANGGGALVYLWDFGDGTTSTEANPRKMYQSEGVFTVSLTVTNANGESTAVKTGYINAEAEVFHDYLIGPILPAKGEATLERLEPGAPGYELMGYFTYAGDPTYFRLAEYDTDEALETAAAMAMASAGEAAFTYDKTLHRIIVAESDGTMRYIATSAL